MVDISLSGSGEGPGWATAPGYSTAAKFPRSITRILSSSESARGGAVFDLQATSTRRIPAILRRLAAERSLGYLRRHFESLPVL